MADRLNHYPIIHLHPLLTCAIRVPTCARFAVSYFDELHGNALAFYSRADDMSINERIASLIKSYNHCFGSSVKNSDEHCWESGASLSLTFGSLEISLAPYLWAEPSKEREEGGREGYI